MSLKSLQNAAYNTLEKLKSLALFYFFKKQFKSWLKNQGFENKKYPGEEKYIKKWKRLTKRVEPYSYRFFSHYCGYSPDIIPEDIGESIIQKKLSPPRFRDFYSDKNLYGQFFKDSITPTTIMCRINGGPVLDKNYQPLSDDIDSFLVKLPYTINRMVLKPSIDSSGGKGIMIFERNKKENNVWWKSVSDNTILSKNYLFNYGRDWVLQENITQHSELARFCKTSLNTIRVCSYKSVKDEKVHITAAVLRIGKDGSICDNATSGGKFVGIDVTTGKLGKYACDKYGNKSETWNNINFSSKDFFIPNWSEVIKFAKRVASQNLHCRAIGLDIAIDEKGNCRLIEYNVKLFGYKLFMYTGQTVFGDHLEEIIEYCKETD